MSSPGLVLWDIDGTLLRAGDPDHICGLRDALCDVAGRPVTFDRVVLGGNIERRIARVALVDAGVAPDAVDALADEAIHRMAHRYAATVTDRRDRLLPGAAAALRALAGAGWTQAVLSGGARLVSETKLRAAGLADQLPVGAYGDEADERHHLVDHAIAAARHEGGRDRVVVVGDTPGDIECARAASVRVVAVATGRWSSEELAAHGPDALLEDLLDPDSVLAALSAAAG